jgi:hypothetical protein
MMTQSMRLLRPSVRSTKNIHLFATRQFCNNAESHDDDEFIFPVQILHKNSTHFSWSGAQVSNSIDLSADSFVGEKKIIYSTEDLKVGDVCVFT